jgi:hypothetical protein
VKSDTRGPAALWLLAMVISAAGCGGGGDGGDQAAAAPGNANPPPAGKQPDAPVPAGRPQLPRSLRVEPAELDLGRMATNTTKTSTFRLINDGPEPITIQDCVSSCGCTNTNCPKGKEIEPGEHADVGVTVTGGGRAKRLEKTVTFRVIDEQSVIVPVVVDVVAYLVIEPRTIDPEAVPDGKITIRSTDGQPFRIVDMNPPLVDEFPVEPSTEQHVFIDWDKWRARGGSRRIYFDVDHPEAKRTSTIVRQSTPRRDIRGRPIGPDPVAANAIKENNVEILESRLAAGLEAPGLNELLTVAARYGRAGMVPLIIEAGADVNAQDARGRTPLMAAVQSRDLATLRALIESGADVNARDKMQSTALLRSAGAFGQLELVRLLLAEGADVNVQDNNGMTPLMWAARWGDAVRVQALLDAGADVAIVDKTGQTALAWAHSRGAKARETVEILEPLTE